MKNNPAVEALLARLITVLSEEMQMYNELLLVLRKKQRGIISGKLEELQQAVIEEQLALKKTELVGTARANSMHDLNAILGDDEQVRTISQLIAQVESTYAQRLAELQLGLQKIVKEVAVANDENRYLLDYSIRFVREAARELIKSSDQFPVYSSKGEGASTAGSFSIIEGTI
ncbi:MAG: flagellar protein FlgN [Candidatus Marinimicrobia bacterium]|nr:flagellar protein FlgN [Candidatus Neomarinimicrobiota bacterium]